MSPWRRISTAIGAVLLAAAAVATAAVEPAAAQDRIASAASAAPVFTQASAQKRTSSLATTNLTYVYWGVWTYGAYTVDIWWGYDYSPVTNNLRAWAEMDGNSSAIHLQFEPLNLGDRNGVLATKAANSQTGFLESETGPVGCHYPNGVYRSNLHYSIRWPDGRLTSKQQTGVFEASASVVCL